MSRFKFLQNDFPKLYTLCTQAEQSTDPSVILLKSRQALEFMIHILGEDTTKDLFFNINQLEEQSILDSNISCIFHSIRRLANQAIHNNGNIDKSKLKPSLDQLLELTIWFALNQGKTYTLTDFSSNDITIARKYLILPQINANNNSNISGYSLDLSLCIDPLNIQENFNIPKDTPQDILVKDIFETQEEYINRIANIDPIHIGYGILDPRRQDNYTHITFLIHHIDKNKKINFFPINAFWTNDINIKDIVDDEIVANLKFYQGKIYCDYSKVYLRNNKELIPLQIIYWDKFAYESDTEYQKRIESLPMIPLGIGMPIRNQYNLEKSALPFMIKPYPYVEKILMPLLIDKQTLLTTCDRTIAKNVCNSQKTVFMFGKFSNSLKLTQYTIWEEAFKEICIYPTSSIDNKQSTNDKPKAQPIKTDEQIALDYLNKANSTKSDKEKVYYLQKATELGNAEAQCNLGYYYEKGVGLDKDIDKAIELYSLSANQGNSDAQLVLALYYENGDSVPKNIDKAIELYSLSANQGNSYAQYLLAHYYKNGDSVPKNIDKAIELFTLSANQGNSDAQLVLAFHYETGNGVPKDIDKAIELFTLSANQGNSDAQKQLQKYTSIQNDEQTVLDYLNKANSTKSDKRKAYFLQKAANLDNAEAQYKLALCYENGIGVKQNSNKFIKFITLSANQGHSYAQYHLAYCYKNGIGINKNIDKAIKLYTLSANQGNSNAQNNLAVCYANGIGINKNIDKAIELYTLSANQGNSYAQFNLANYYENGVGLDKDINKAIELYTLSANQGHSNAQKQLQKYTSIQNDKQIALNYLNKANFSKSDKEKVYYLQEAANLGNAEAQFNLAKCYQNGTGVLKNIDKAIELFTLSANQGYAKAQYHLAVCYENSNGVPKDISKAIELYTLSANQNYAQAQNDLGMCYALGNGLTQNWTKAIELFTLAIEQNNPSAQFNLGMCYLLGNGVKKNLYQAIEYFNLANEQNYASAQWALGFCYEHGYAVNLNYIKAVNFYKLAANQNYAKAQYNLGLCYKNGIGTDVNLSEAIKLFKLASKQGDNMAKKELDNFKFLL